MNSGNTEGEYVNVKSTDFQAPPSSTDHQDRAWYSGLKKGAADFWDGVTTTSDTAKTGQGVVSRAWDYTADPSLIQKDATSAWNALPTPQEAWEGTKNFVVGAGTGAAHVAQQVWDDPGGSASKSANWVKGEASSAVSGTKAMYAKVACRRWQAPRLGS
ncbi:hypothetical protein PR017_24000 (plasmid) [Rhizobium tumorigenes]|uniref:Uncharacterized protein n=1 Tax=Rhizobium tumorigenes TaxID=2041385 RepID=A0AAF1KC88_9HYPH|nr:hypothetical protein [Rhizobium tumorigenes]WFR98764.1 hypothetical protein PR017_24000 [Rhizobium tumorigenes]